MFDFDKITDRHGTNSMKWDECKGALPLWVADMDFETAPCVKEAVLKRAEHGIYGYSVVPDEWAEAYSAWWKRRHGLEMEKDALIFCTGIVPAISSLVRKLTTPAEKVLIQTPVYNIFFNSILNNGRFVVESPLDYDEKNCTYAMNFSRLEKDLSDPQVSLMILCNPHNPCGNVWTRDELERVGELCKKYGVTIISDEIHCDITEKGFEYVPFAGLSESCRMNSVTCIAPSKAFNIAGLNSAAVYVPNPVLRHKVWRALNTDEVAEPNVFAVQAALSAFTKGETWLTELNAYLSENKRFAKDFIRKNIPALKITEGKATYLLWADCSKVSVPGAAERVLSGDEFSSLLLKKTGLLVSGGSQFGKAGKKFIRINIACPRSVLKDALERLRRFVAEGL